MVNLLHGAHLLQMLHLLHVLQRRSPCSSYLLQVLHLMQSGYITLTRQRLQYLQRHLCGQRGLERSMSESRVYIPASCRFKLRQDQSGDGIAPVLWADPDSHPSPRIAWELAARPIGKRVTGWIGPIGPLGTEIRKKGAMVSFHYPSLSAQHWSRSGCQSSRNVEVKMTSGCKCRVGIVVPGFSKRERESGGPISSMHGDSHKPAPGVPITSIAAQAGRSTVAWHEDLYGGGDTLLPILILSLSG